MATTTTVKKTKTTEQAPANDYTKQLQQIVSTPYQKQEYSNPYTEKLLALTAPKTDAEYKKLATNQYMPQYNAALEALQQAAQKENLGYDRQLATLATAIQDSRENTNATYAKNISDLNNNMLRRGIARSSYAGQIEANARTGWANALSKLERDYQANVDNVNAQRQLTTSQLAQSEARLKKDLATNIANYEQTLRSNDKSAQLSAYNQLMSAYDSWNQAQTQLQQNKASMDASILQFLAGYNLDKEQFDLQQAYDKEKFEYQKAMDKEQFELQKAQFEFQKAQANKKATQPKSGPSEPEPTPTPPTLYDGKTFNEFTASMYSSTPTKKVSSNSSDFYSAAVEYAVEQIRRQNGEII